MDNRAQRLRRFVRGDKDLASALVGAGLDTPAKVKAATDATILAVEGIGPSKLAIIRERLG